MTEINPFPDTRPLWFEPFLQRLKRELGYPINIGKYRQLLTWANDHPWGDDEVKMGKLYSMCKILFLESLEHEHRFSNIFRDYIIDELAYEQSKLEKNKTQKKAEVNETGQSSGNKNIIDTLKVDDNKKLQKEISLPEPPDENETIEKVSSKKYLNLTIPKTPDDVSRKTNSPGTSRFLLSEGYLPLTKREMIHGWRHLRKGDRLRPSTRLDVKATVNNIANNGMLLHPVFENDQVNSDDLLLILADRRGSMMPFHKFTDKLIETAIKGGGHRKALVYYFMNCPVDCVYKNPNLSDPVPISKLYSLIRPDHTNALIISDAGAARGNKNELRIRKTFEFLYGSNDESNINGGLQKNALFVAWINPMPHHRWKNTTAAAIASDTNTPMISLMENGYWNFLHVMNKLMGK